MLFEHTKCKKCNHTNPAYRSICEICKSYLRERVVNIDLWKTIQQIIEDPTEAFRQIIFAEHKNFIFFITFFIAIKNLIITRFMSVPQLGSNGVANSFAFSITGSIILTVVFLSTITAIQLKLYNGKEIKLRFVDIYAMNSYSFIPYLFGLVFIFPVELIVLGGDIFSNNPYAFQIKPVITYILLGIEFIVILWSFVIFNKSMFILGIKLTVSIFITTFFLFLWFTTLFVSSKIIFTL